MAQEKNWYQIIIDNWAQITVLLGMISFITVTLVNWSLKKKEIKLSKLMEHKVIEIKAFLKSYHELELSLKNYLHQTEFGNHSPEIFKKIRENIIEKLLAFQYQRMTIKLFLRTEDIEIIDETYKTLNSARISIGSWHIYHKTGSSLEKAEEADKKLNELSEKVFPEELPSLIKKLENNVRKSFELN